MAEAAALRQVADNVVRSLRKSDEVLAVWYYGAAQRERSWEESDVDLLVLTRQQPFSEETRAERNDVLVHLHWIGVDEFEQKIQANGDPHLHSHIGGGELLYDREARFGELMERLGRFPDEYRFYHILPHLDALIGWARDLRKRMALHDERPRRAAARQWEVDNHAAAVLLIEKGLFPHNEATTQALNARIFVPNQADPTEIEAFVRPRVERWILPQLRAWADEGDFDDQSLRQRHGTARCARLLEFAAREGWLKRVRANGRSQVPLQEIVYRTV